MKHFVGIPLFLLALPMVAAEAPMSYVRFTTPDPLALYYPSLSPLLRKQPCMQRGFGWDNNGSKQRCCDANCFSRTSRKHYKQFKY